MRLWTSIIGAGTLLAKRAGFVSAVETWSAVRDLRRNLELTKLDNVDTVGVLVENSPLRITILIVLIHSRPGLAPEVIRRLRAIALRIL